MTVARRDARSAPDPIPVVWCVDVEPMHRQVEEPPELEWHGVLETMALVDRWRPALEDATDAPVHFSWFWRADPQIEEIYGVAEWGLVRYRDMFDAMLLRGDEHGVHPHFWRRHARSDAWIADYRDPSWAEHCVRLALGAFERQFGYSPRVNRCGDRWMDTETARLLRRLGFHVDLTVEPGVPGEYMESNAPLPDYTGAVSRPYRPAARDFLRPRRLHLSRRGLVMLPLTTRFAAVGGAPGSFHPWDDPTVTAAAFDALLAGGQRYFAFAIRTDHCLQTWWPNIEELLAHMRRHPQAKRFIFMTPSEAVNLLRRAA